MNSSTQNAIVPDAASVAGAAEETLRLIARLPAPEGLEDRVKAGLRATPRTARVLHWPAALRPGQGWMHSTVARSAAAAAIVFAVAGGGWGVYWCVQPALTPRAVVMPPRVAAPGGFSSAGAMRTPQTLNGPVLAHPVTAAPRHTHGAVKAPGRAVRKRLRGGKVVKAGRPANHDAVSQAK